MSLILPTNGVDPGTRDPRTHVLIIGVNEYPHLENGSAFPAHRQFTMGQLTSPVPSAIALADWLIGQTQPNYRNSDAPLETVEMLLSPGAGQSAAFRTQPVGEADMASIEEAFDAWEARCDRNEKNIGLFYFCGHGLEASVGSLLLAKDFGENPNRFWKNAIDFNATWLGMWECKAKTQVYVLDACRDAPTEAMRGTWNKGSTLKDLLGSPSSERDARVFKATGSGQQAHGDPGKVSYFTEALLDCLQRLGASHNDGQNWLVKTDSLGIALTKRMRRNVIQDGTRRVRLSCDTAGGAGHYETTLHQLDRASVMAEICCQPVQANHDVEMLLSDGTNRKTHGPSNDPWELEVEADAFYDVDGRIVHAGRYTTIKPLMRQMAHPPMFQKNVEVT